MLEHENRFTNVQFANWLGNKLGETEPRQKFHLWSAICLVGQTQAIQMANRAYLLHQGDKSHTIGGWWYSQMPENDAPMMYRIRQGIREFLSLEPHSVPDCFR